MAVALIALLIAACAAPGGSVPPSAANTASPAPSTAAAPASPTPAGPTAFAEWVDRQGFGGSSGLRDINKLALWLQDNMTIATAYDVTSETTRVARLIDWLDTHPATACWTSFRSDMLAILGKLHDSYSSAAAAMTASQTIPTDVVEAIVADAGAAFKMADPADCP